MANFRDLCIGLLALLLSIVVLAWLSFPVEFGEHLQKIDDGRFINMEQDNGPVLE